MAANNAQLVLRLGLALVFGWLGIDKFIDAGQWHGLIPGWLAFIPSPLFVYVMGAIQVMIALLLLSGRLVRIAAIAGAAILVLSVAGSGINELAVCEIGIIAMAIALALGPHPRRYHELHDFHRFVRQRRR